MAQAIDQDEKVERFRREVLPPLVEKFSPSKVLVFGVELLCYTPAEYERKRQELGIVQTGTQEGVDLLERDGRRETSDARLKEKGRG